MVKIYDYARCEQGEGFLCACVCVNVTPGRSKWVYNYVRWLTYCVTITSYGHRCLARATGKFETIVSSSTVLIFSHLA
jgi:hypothetical protein